MPGNPNGDLVQILNKAFVMTPNCQMMMFILPFDGGLYSSLKNILDCDMGIPSQCLRFQKLKPNNGPYLTNVALKVNIKLGGTNHKLKDKLPMFDVPTLILGADVTHPSGGSNTPSIAAVVGSVSGSANSYVVKISYQQGRQEYIGDFEEMFLHCVHAFKTSNKVLPRRIIYYRDGVGEGMFKEVKRQEIAAMLSSKTSPRTLCPNGFQRHGPQVYELHCRHNRRNWNWASYLQSQAGLQGTSRPTHYHVLHDENKFTPDSLQDLTNRMCYLQGRCTRSVRIVTAVYHADLVCYRARCHLIYPEGWSQSSSGKGNLRPEVTAKKVSDKLDGVRSSSYLL
ncbi:protein argonaute-2 [Endogone sp. FLAS-F59071]|nr:protein argonaute-2 [Endogone sp. FLAS-F59071]|eukprot:RUS13712.1 protein argonaute-2 [Endogone sp. FLAS-F59071]